MIKFFSITLSMFLMSCSTHFISPKEKTCSALTETIVRINMYIQENQIFPVTLDELPVRNGYANRTVDAWNRPLIYKVEDNNYILLFSYGKDGEIGGVNENEDISIKYRTKNDDGSWNVYDNDWITTAKIKGFYVKP